ncbi:hypothetical protein GVAV_003500 [Gurleya vavrai]
MNKENKEKGKDTGLVRKMTKRVNDIKNNKPEVSDSNEGAIDKSKRKIKNLFGGNK